MHIAEIKTADIANGPGIRLVIFVSGCLNHCKGCFQPETWDFLYGRQYSEEIEKFIFDELKKPYYTGVTFLGGDPFELGNQKEILPLLKKIREMYPKLDIWFYTGYIYDRDLVFNGKRYLEDVTEEILDNLDILVDGPYVEALYDISLQFRGSSNQRVIDMKKTIASGEIVIWDQLRK